MASRQEAKQQPGTRRPPAPRRQLNRREVTDTAIALIERDGLDALTMRRLAAELGCAPMSLYTHVRSRDDLVDAIVDRLIERLELHDQPGESWQAAARRTIHAYRDLAVQVPHAFELLALAPYDASPVAPHLTSVLAGLEHTGLAPETARQVLGIIDAYASGFLVVWARGGAAAGRPTPDARPEVAAMRNLETFDQGLEALIAGLDATLVGGPAASAPPTD